MGQSLSDRSPRLDLAYVRIVVTRRMTFGLGSMRCSRVKTFYALPKTNPRPATVALSTCGTRDTAPHPPSSARLPLKLHPSQLGSRLHLPRRSRQRKGLPAARVAALRSGTQLHLKDACFANLASRMLSIGKIAVGQHRYYEQQVAQGARRLLHGPRRGAGRVARRRRAGARPPGRVSAGQFNALVAGLDPRDPTVRLRWLGA